MPNQVTRDHLSMGPSSKANGQEAWPRVNPWYYQDATSWTHTATPVILGNNYFMQPFIPDFSYHTMHLYGLPKHNKRKEGSNAIFQQFKAMLAKEYGTPLKYFKWYLAKPFQAETARKAKRACLMENSNPIAFGSNHWQMERPNMPI